MLNAAMPNSVGIMNAIMDAQQADNGSGSNNNNALVLSLYLIDSEDDIILHDDAVVGNSSESNNNTNIQKRARVYQRLCKACSIANGILRDCNNNGMGEGKGKGKGDGKQQQGSTKTQPNNRPWSSGGDGPLFGIHCDTSTDESFHVNANDDIDGDDIWQSQSPQDNDTNDEISNALRQNNNKRAQQQQHAGVGNHHSQQQQQQPHLRAICRYGNDINDMWRCISLALQISSTLSQSHYNLSCAIECWDMADGHILLIEAAECLPSWVDDDVLQGGVGGPVGCRNRCWLVDGRVCLIPPSSLQNGKQDDGKCKSSSCGQNASTLESVDRLSRKDALCSLMQSSTKAMNGNGSSSSATVVYSESMQCAIQDRINRTDYTNARPGQHVNENNNGRSKSNEVKDNADDSRSNPHWHVAPVALPASVAHFIRQHPLLVPLMVDSFCERAPGYLKEGSSKPNTSSPSRSPSGTTKSFTAKKMGQTFPYEQMVILPVAFTRANYAELVTGRGVVPSFPIPNAYKSVELNRFQRQLRQSAFGHDNDALDKNEGNEGGLGKRRNPFGRAVDVGVRLCAGLDWIVSDDGGRKATQDLMKIPVAGLDDVAIRTLGEVERRLRIYWTRIDVEASTDTRFGGTATEEQNSNNSSPPLSLHWIEQAWQAGPNGSGAQHAEDYDKSLLTALEPMSKCHIFNPELSKPLWQEPCPYTRPSVSLPEMVESGMKSALKWVREKFDEEDCFPTPRAREMDDDGWMEVNSLEELEEEMKTISSSRRANVDSTGKAGSGKPRRTTRRSRRKMAQSNPEEAEKCDEEDDEQHEDLKSLDKVLSGFQSFVEGKGELEGAVTKPDEKASELVLPTKTKENSADNRHSQRNVEPETLMSQEVNINPRKFLNILHAMLSDATNSASQDSDLGANSDGIMDHKEQKSSHAMDIDQDVSKYFFEEDLNDNMSDGSDSSNGGLIDEEVGYPEPQGGEIRSQDPWSLHNIMEAMDHELRTDVASDPSIKNVSVASEGENADGETGDSNVAILANLLSSIDAQGNGSGPATTILREMGICPPRPPTTDGN